MSEIDKSMYDVSKNVSKQDRVTGNRVLNSYSRENEIKKGNAAIEEYLEKISGEGKKYNEAFDKTAYRRVVEIFNRLHLVSHLNQEKWTPIIVDDPSFNAFTTGGTSLVIFSGLEKSLDSDAELASVIAHEMGHVAASHVFEARTFNIANAISNSSSAKRNSFHSSFTHEQEEEADRIGILYCALAGYDPYAASRVWKDLNRTQGSHAQIIQDHPISIERARQTYKTAVKVEKYYTENKINDNFGTILSDNSLWKTNKINWEENAGKGGGLFSLVELAGHAYLEKEKAKKEENRQKRRVKFIQSVQKCSQVKISKPVSNSTWQAIVAYNGNRSIKNIQMRASFKKKGKPILSVVVKLNGYVKPRQQFRINFTHPNLKAKKFKRGEVGISYDYVELL